MTNRSPQRIVVVPLRFIGDTIITVPLLRNLRHHFPQATVDVVASPAAAQLLAPCPYINATLPDPGSKAIIHTLRQGHYDTALILRKSFTMAWQCQKAGIESRIGYDMQRFIAPIGFRRLGLFLTHALPYPQPNTTTHQAVHHLNHLKPLGVRARDDYLELWSTEHDETAIDRLFQFHGLYRQRQRNPKLAILHTVSASSGKTLPISAFAKAAQQLNDTGYTLLCTGLEADRPLYDTLAQQTKVPLINICGETSLRETYTLLKRAGLIVTVDSSPVHLAAAAGVPTLVGVYSHTNPAQWGPHNPTTAFFPALVQRDTNPQASHIITQAVEQALKQCPPA